MTHSSSTAVGARAPLALALLTVLLAGCGDDAATTTGTGATSGGEGGGGAPAPVATVPVVVTPSLGQVFSGTVRVIAPGGGGEEVSELARSKTKENGKADLEVPATDEGPYIVEVSGNDTATYYDEGTDQTVPLGEDDTIRAVVDELPAGGVGVTPLTEMAVRHLEAQYGPLTALTRAQLRELFSSGVVAAAYAKIRSELAPELGDTSLVSVPAIVGSKADLNALGTTPADLYALKLAALARVGSLNGAATRPALAILDDLGKDLADGVFDGKQGAEALAPVTYSLQTFAAQLQDSAQHLAASTELKTLVASYEQYVSDFIAALGKVGDPVEDGGTGGGETGGGGVVVAPGDLLASWAGSYQGSWNVERLEAFIKVPTLSYPFYKWVRDPVSEEAMRLSMLAMTFGGNTCNWAITAQNVQFGALTLPFGDAFSAAAVGDARSYTLPVSLTVLSLGVTGTTTLNTQGVLPTRIALEYHYKGLLKELHYTGACTFTYPG